MAVHGSCVESTHPLLTNLQIRRPDFFASVSLEVPLRSVRIRFKEIGVKRRAAAAALGFLLMSAPAVFFSWNGRVTQARSGRESGTHNDAAVLLAKTAGLSNPDEANALLAALEDGTLDHDTVSSALDADASRKAAEIRAAAEMEAAKKAAEEKAAAKKAEAAAKAAAAKALAERKAAGKAAAQKAAAEKAAAEKAAAEKAASEKAAAKKAAAEWAFRRFGKIAPQSLMETVSDDDEENDDLSRDNFEDKETFSWDDFEDGEFDEEDSGPLSSGREERKHGSSYDRKRGEISFSKRENRHTPNAKSSRDGLTRKRSPTPSDEFAENGRDDTEQWEEEEEGDDEGKGTSSGSSSSFYPDKRSRSSRAPPGVTAAATNDGRQVHKGRVGRAGPKTESGDRDGRGKRE